MFSDEIFPAIDEERFEFCILKMLHDPIPQSILLWVRSLLFALSDDEIVENLMLDIHYQYALHTTSYEEQPLSDKSCPVFGNAAMNTKKLPA